MKLKTSVEENLPAQFKLESAGEKVLVHMLENNVWESNRIKNIWHGYI